MVRQTAKQYLRQLEILDLKIRQRKLEYDRLISEAMCNGSPVLSPDKVQTSMDGDRMGGRVAEAAEVAKEIEWLTAKLIKDRHRIIGEIQSLENAKYIELLYLRYVDMKTLAEVADIMKRPSGKVYSYDHIIRLHGYALKDFDRKVLKCHSNAI